MIPQAHICCKCKKQVVWGCCLPAICFECREKEEFIKEQNKLQKDLPEPIIVETQNIRCDVRS